VSGLDLAGLGYDAQRAAAVRLLAAGERLTTDELYSDGRIDRAGRPFRYFVPAS